VLLASVAIRLVLPLSSINLGVTWASTFLNIGGLALLLKSRHYFQISADTLLSVDQRKPIILLRSFDDDEHVQFKRSAWQLLDFSLETRLQNHFQQYGPFVAIESTAESLPQIGAARAKLRDDEWQNVVLDWIARSSLILMLAGKTQGVSWELAQVADKQCVDKLIILLPTNRSFLRSRRRAESTARLDHVKTSLLQSPWTDALNTISDAQSVRAITFTKGGGLVVIRANDFSREAYHLATLAAHEGTSPTEADSGPVAKTMAPTRRPRASVIGALLGLLLLVPFYLSLIIGVPPWSVSYRASRAASELDVTFRKNNASPHLLDHSTAILLLRITDTSTLKHNPSQLGPKLDSALAVWSDAIHRTYQLYILQNVGIASLDVALTSAKTHDELWNKMETNLHTYHVELGYCFDAQMKVLDKLIVYLATLDAGPIAEDAEDTKWKHIRSHFLQRIGVAPSINSISAIRDVVTQGLFVDLWAMDVLRSIPHWAAARVGNVALVLGDAANFLTKDQLEFLGKIVTAVANNAQDEAVRTKLRDLSEQLRGIK
jgi:hypothetical protein